MSTAEAYIPRHEPTFGAVILAALRELRDARRDLHEAKRQLRAPDLTPGLRGGAVRKHDRAAQRVTKARFSLDQAIDASEEP